MGVYYRVSCRCYICKNRVQVDTKDYLVFDKTVKSARICSFCRGKVEVKTSIATTDWEDLKDPSW
jgi:hypothetical protein